MILILLGYFSDTWFDYSFYLVFFLWAHLSSMSSLLTHSSVVSTSSGYLPLSLLDSHSLLQYSIPSPPLPFSAFTFLLFPLIISPNLSLSLVIFCLPSLMFPPTSFNFLPVLSSPSIAPFPSSVPSHFCTLSPIISYIFSLSLVIFCLSSLLLSLISSPSSLPIHFHFPISPLAFFLLLLSYPLPIVSNSHHIYSHPFHAIPSHLVQFSPLPFPPPSSLPIPSQLPFPPISPHHQNLFPLQSNQFNSIQSIFGPSRHSYARKEIRPDPTTPHQTNT